MRQIFIVNATQLVTSASHPEGLFSIMSGFPKTFDSGEESTETAMKSARSAYYAQLSANYANANPNRVMTTVTLETANGHQILRESVGAFPTTQPEEVSEE